MRISNMNQQQSLLRDLQARLVAMQEAQRQQATGKRIDQPSDDPAATAEVLRTTVDLSSIAQFRKNATAVRTNLSAEDAVETTLGQLLGDAKKVAIGAASALPTDPLRQSAITQLNLLISEVVDLGNTQVGGEYIFGGFRTDAPPFQKGAGPAVTGSTVGSTEATVVLAGTAAPGVYQLANDVSAPGSVTLTNSSDPTQTETITGVTAGTTSLAFATLGVTLNLGTGWSVATGTAPGSLNGDTIAVANGISYLGDDNARQIEVDSGSQIVTNHSGGQLFGNALGALQALVQQLGSGTSAAVNGAVPTIDAAQQEALGLQTETGVILKQLDATSAAITSRETGLLNRRSTAQDVDPNQAAVQLLEAQNSLQAAYAATGRVLSLSLTDYLK